MTQKGNNYGFPIINPRSREEENERFTYINDVVSLMQEFTSRGIPTEAAAQLVAAFYTNRNIPKRRDSKK